MILGCCRVIVSILQSGTWRITFFDPRGVRKAEQFSGLLVFFCESFGHCQNRFFAAHCFPDFLSLLFCLLFPTGAFSLTTGVRGSWWLWCKESLAPWAATPLCTRPRRARRTAPAPHRAGQSKRRRSHL